jgi:hypothetical protein
MSVNYNSFTELKKDEKALLWNTFEEYGIVEMDFKKEDSTVLFKKVFLYLK